MKSWEVRMMSAKRLPERGVRTDALLSERALSNTNFMYCVGSSSLGPGFCVLRFAGVFSKEERFDAARTVLHVLLLQRSYE